MFGPKVSRRVYKIPADFAGRDHVQHMTVPLLLALLFQSNLSERSAAERSFSYFIFFNGWNHKERYKYNYNIKKRKKSKIKT